MTEQLYSERSLLIAQQIANMGSWEWRVADNRVAWSDQLYRIYGLSRDGFAASFEAFLERLHPEDRENTRRAIETALRTREPFEFEERIIRPDGEVRLLRSRGEVMLDEAGNVSSLVGTCLDITELREASNRAAKAAIEREARLFAEQQAERMQFLADASRELSSSIEWQVTLQSVARAAVPNFADWCAVDIVTEAGEVERLAVEHHDPLKVRLAKDLQRRYPPRSREEDGVRRVIESRKPEYVREIPPEMIERSARDEDHLQIIRQLQLRSYIIAPLVHGENTYGAITFVRAESGRLFEDVDVDLATELAARAGTAIEHARVVRDLRIAHATLEEQAAEVEAQAEELQNLMEEVEIANEDLRLANESILHERDLAQQMRAAAEEANRAKSQFLGNMSHELRTPLNAIAGYAELLQIGVHGALTEPQRLAVDRIQRSERHLLSLINDLLQFVKIEAGHVELRPQQVLLQDRLASVDALIEPQIRAKQLMYTCELPADDVFIYADPDKFDQVLINVLSNAVKFTPAGGRIELRTNVDEHQVRIHATDSGVGIPADMQERIFEPFTRVESSQRLSEGLGLGLAITRDILTAMGGTISVASEPGVGSTFTIVLQRAPETVLATTLPAVEN